jgi:hypothetical protein
MVGAFLAARRWMRDLYCLGTIELWRNILVVPQARAGNRVSLAAATATVEVNPEDLEVGFLI